MSNLKCGICGGDHLHHVFQAEDSQDRAELQAVVEEIALAALSKELEDIAKGLTEMGRGLDGDPDILYFARRVRLLKNNNAGKELCPACGSPNVIGWQHDPEHKGCYDCWVRWTVANPEKWWQS